MSGEAGSGRTLPPLWYWLLPLVVAALRMLPVVSLRWTAPPPGQAFLGVSYLPKDFLQYAAFIRQAAESGALFLYDPFTTDPQSGRFLLLFHWLAGLGARLCGAPAVAALEWSRVPLLFLFFATLWWFLRPVLADERDRLAAAVLVAFAGGVEGWLRLFVGELPAAAAARFQQDTSALHGWSLFASFYNPLWIAALTLAMLVLRPLLFCPRRSLRSLAVAGAAFCVLFFVHPYTAVGVLAIAGAGPALALPLGGRPDLRKSLVDAAALGSAALVIAAISAWQLQDPVYRESTGGVFGPQNLSVLWYPVTLGALGGLAALGALRWLAARHPLRFALFGWIAAVAVLHSLPFVNGYKFVFLLPLPLCILAAPVAREAVARRRGLALGAGVLLFGGAAFQTIDAVRTAASVGAIPADAMSMVDSLAALPAGNTLAPPGLGNVLPAFTPHRVWVGHWFLTPDFAARQETYARLVRDRRAEPELRELLSRQRIRYLVVPAGRGDIVAGELEPLVRERVRRGELELLILGEPGSDEGEAAPRPAAAG